VVAGVYVCLFVMGMLLQGKSLLGSLLEFAWLARGKIRMVHVNGCECTCDGVMTCWRGCVQCVAVCVPVFCACASNCVCARRTSHEGMPGMFGIGAAHDGTISLPAMAIDMGEVCGTLLCVVEGVPCQAVHA